MATAKKAAKKPAAKKPAAKKPAAKKPAAKKPAAKKAPAKKAARKEGRREEARREAQAQCRVHEGDDAFGRRWPRSSAASPLPRTEVTKKIWDYIKKNKLQDAINRRLINADEKLKAVFGGKGKVSMFEMTKLVSNHLK